MRLHILTFTFITVLLWGPIHVALAQKVMEYELCSPDSITYSIAIGAYAHNERHISIDFGYFNYSDTPEVHIWVKPGGMPFIIDEAVWTIAYIKPIINKRKRIDIGTWGEVITYRYQNKYNKLFPAHFTEEQQTHSSHGNLYFTISGTHLPKFINIYHYPSTSSNKTDSLLIENKGATWLEIGNIVGTHLPIEQVATKPILIAPKHKLAIAVNALPDAQTGQHKQLTINYRQKGQPKWQIASYRCFMQH